MFRYKLRTLLIVLALGPPLLAWTPAILSGLNEYVIRREPLDFTSHVPDKQWYLTKVAVGDGQLLIGKRSYGPVKEGDQIRLGPGDGVFVNDQRRWPE
jgi:hypothetical protein